jgi:hypothetical protein
MISMEAMYALTSQLAYPQPLRSMMARNFS